MTLPRWILGYWGKARPARADGPAWHPLAYHGLDVAAAMAALLDLRPALLNAIARAAGLSPQDARRALILLAAFHDLGKFAENFQQKVEIPGIIPAAPGVIGSSQRGHGGVGLRLWETAVQAGPAPLSVIAARLGQWIDAAFGHHGAPVESKGFHLAEALSPAARDDALAFVNDCLGFLPMPEASVDGADEIWQVAGLLILADWIGSNQTWFPYAPPDSSLEAYWQKAQGNAKDALAKAALREAPIAPGLDLSDLIGPQARPSPLQRFAAAEAPPREPTLYIIEDLTGSGKTEAALLLAHRLMAAGQAEGLYWALPSKATANALYARLAAVYRRLFQPDTDISPWIVLAHGDRDLNPLFADSRRPGGEYYGETRLADEQSAEAQCAAFLADDMKKTFLGQIGIGTIDQALLSVLPVRHQSLRICALSRRVLVVDEAHAYDDYVQAELARLLEFHSALGGSAIVLSATLTKSQRRDLCRRYQRTRGGDLPNAGAVKLTEDAFPLVTRVSAQSLVETPQDAARGTRRDLPFRLFSTVDQALESLIDAASAGLCGVYIRNTVTDAIAAVQRLRALAPPGVDVALFHARFALGDRLAHENNALGRFGKNSTPDDRRGRILVATQVVEQSLDVDFDVMVTDLCPMDLLIQRAGRLHRHADRPSRPPPVLSVVAPPTEGAITAQWYAALFPQGQFVYRDVGQLWRTLSVLKERGGLPLLSASPRLLIEAVFGDSAAPLPPTLEQPSFKAEGKRQAERAVGYVVSLERSAGYSQQVDAWKTETQATTRLGDQGIRLRLARWQKGQLRPWFDDPDPWRAWRLSEVSVRRGFGTPIPPDALAAKAMAAHQARWPDRSDPPLLVALTATDDPDLWGATWSDEDDAVRRLHYSASEGFQIDEILP
ncbi:CRISPR-associated helicase Cas3' [Rhodospirillum rubrum]|nr:CRISPR-associated helicase Cas3' [Rhodospirillum rubrum]